ncbi:MAG: hypothetical protein HZB29_09770 [Nitrospinae bacterium]|nr:hypothetical protein [Nitrospinota bacterium]
MTIATLKRTRILPTNHTLQAVSATCAPAPLSGYDAANLKNPARTKLCKVAGTTMTLNIRLNGVPSVAALAVCGGEPMRGIGYSVNATIRAWGNDVAADWTNAKYDTGEIPAYPPAGSFGAGLFGDNAMGGYISPSTSRWWRPVFILFFAEVQAYEYWQIQINDPLGDGYISIGIVGLCSVVELARNITDGWSHTPVDTTQAERTTGGGIKTTRPGVRYVEMSANVKGYPTAEMWSLSHMFMILGETTPCFVAFHPDDEVNSPWTTLYGTLKYSGLTRPANNLNDFALTLKEQPTLPAS